MQTVEVDLNKEESNVAVLPPQILEYDDYQEFLRDFYLSKKSQNKNFSYRRFATLAGIKSSNFLMLVMQKERRLSPEMAKSVAKAMKLSKAEADYFVLLVKLEASETDAEKARLEKERKVAVCKIITTTLPREKAEYLSSWHYPLVRELAFLPDFEPTAKWIATKLAGVISEKQAEKAIEILVKLGLWEISKSGKVKVSDLYVATESEDYSYGEIKVVDIHKGNLRAWADTLDTIPASERELGIINIPINHSKIPEFKKRIQSFQDEIIGWLQDESQPTQLVQLGTYLVPMTKKLKE